MCCSTTAPGPRIPAGAHRASAPAARGPEIRTPANATPARATPGAHAPTLLGLGGADAPGGRARRVGLPALGRSPASHRHRARRRCRARNPRPPWAGAGPRPSRTGPAPARPRRGHRVTPARGPGRPLTVRSECSPRSTATAARAAVCAAPAALADPLSRAQDRRRSRIGARRSRLQGGLRGRRLDDAGVFQGVLDTRCMGRRDVKWR